MAGMPLDRARNELVRLVHRGLDLAAFFEAADHILARTLSPDARCLPTLDPATLLPTSHFAHEVGEVTLMDLVGNEFLENYINKNRDPCAGDAPGGDIAEATHGHPELSARYVRVLALNGYANGDELRGGVSRG